MIRMMTQWSLLHVSRLQYDFQLYNIMCIHISQYNYIKTLHGMKTGWLIDWLRFRGLIMTMHIQFWRHVTQPVVILWTYKFDTRQTRLRTTVMDVSNSQEKLWLVKCVQLYVWPNTQLKLFIIKYNYAHFAIYLDLGLLIQLVIMAEIDGAVDKIIFFVNGRKVNRSS